jgi:hypothetical protein
MKSILSSSFKQRRDLVQHENEVSKTIVARDYKETRCVVVGNIDEGKWGKVSEMHQRVFSPDGVCPTLTGSNGGNQEKKIIVAGKLDGGKWDKTYNINKVVYDTAGISPSLMAAMGNGGNTEIKVVDDIYKNRELREYQDTCPTLRADRQGLKVVAGQMQPVNRH